MVAMATPNEGLPRQTKGTGRGGGGGRVRIPKGGGIQAEACLRLRRE